MTTENLTFAACTPADELEVAEKALAMAIAGGSEKKESLIRFAAFIGLLSDTLINTEAALQFHADFDFFGPAGMVISNLENKIYNLRRENDELRNELEVFKKRGKLEES